jgi:hypothetical protein
MEAAELKMKVAETKISEFNYKIGLEHSEALLRVAEDDLENFHESLMLMEMITIHIGHSLLLVNQWQRPLI